MKKYTFPLEQVRRVRRAQEDIAKAHLLAANNEVQKAIAATEMRMAKYQQSGQPNAGVTGVDAFMRARFFNDLAGEAVTVARAAQAVADEFAAQRRDEWKVVATKLKALDRLDERRREEHQLESDRDMEREVDEIVTGRYTRAQAARLGDA